MTGALPLSAAPGAPRPAHVPADRVRDFDVWSPPGFERDVHAAWKALQDASPDVVWTPRNGGHWVALRAAPIKEAFEDYARFSSHCILVPKEAGESFQWKPVTLDPPEHGPYRIHLTTAFAPKAFRPYEPRIRSVARALVEEFRERGHCDFQRDFAEKMPIMIFMEIMDLPLEDAWTLKAWSDRMTRRVDEDAGDVTRAFADYLLPHVRARRDGTGQDAISALVNSRVGDARIDEEDALILVTSALQAGLDTVANVLGFTFTHLARFPQLRRQLAADPALIPAAVDELLRRYGVITIGRLVVGDTELCGARLKAGEMIVLPSMLVGLDERANPDPFAVRPERRPMVEAAFGGGAHRCPGERLARRELAIAIEEWLRAIPEFALEEDAALAYQTGVVPVATAIPLRWNPATTHAPTAQMAQE